MSGLKDEDPRRALFVTFTAPGSDALPDARAIAAWNEGASRRWERLIGRLRRKFPGLVLENARVFELQKRGAVHVHVVIRGAFFIPHGVLSRLAVASGFGPIVDVRRVTEARGVSSYLGSYLAKSRTAFPKGARVYGTSRGWRRGWVKRVTEPGRWIAGPPRGMSWWEWAGALPEARGGDGGVWALLERPVGVWEPPPGLFDPL